MTCTTLCPAMSYIDELDIMIDNAINNLGEVLQEAGISYYETGAYYDTNLEDYLEYAEPQLLSRFANCTIEVAEFVITTYRDVL